ncbi:MAG: tetratricopeptide repeat protein [Treponema sp.]|jgi:tetratricopeptide (TPR) repeat protein|nr:tetratricopeptide repeat protein [Treponema sp.]
MKIDPVLNKAARLARMRNFESALKIMQEEEDRYYGSFKYYYLYGVICLYAGSFAEAHKSFNLARKIHPQDPMLLLGFAILYLKRMDTVQAVDYYLDVQEMDPENKTAKKALTVIRKHSTTEELSDWMAENLHKLFPPIPSARIMPKTIFGVSLIAAAVVIAACGILIKVNVLPNPFPVKTQRSTAEFTLSVQERNASVETGGSYRYILTRDQAIGLYDRALSMFTSWRDEAAKVNLNRLLESNASDGLKNRARLLLENMTAPGFDSFRREDNFTLSDVKNEPVIYRDVYVIWRGMATNVEVLEEYTRFDFLVGYDTRRTLEGIVPVVFDRPVALNSERPLEVLGKIKLQGNGTPDFQLEGAAIYQSGRLEND